MLPRYTSAAVADLFSDTSRYASWQQVEVAAVRAGAAEGLWSSEVAELVAAAPCPSAEQVAAWENRVAHDVVAFLLAWTEPMEERERAAVHRGMTSSDVVDTALSLQLVAAAALLNDAFDLLFDVLRDHALAHRSTVRLGRTHGQVATVEVWGHRVADFAFALDRGRRRFAQTAEEVAVAKLSGPTGGYHGIGPAVEARAASLLGLGVAEVATQVVMRDRLAAWASTLSVIATICEALAVEVRLGQHHALAELSEGVGHGQRGSSAMPHKRNPVRAEQICGLARLVRGALVPLTEGIVLWHERDLSQSSVERVLVPDLVALSEYIVTSTTRLVGELRVDTEAMGAAVNAAGAQTQTHAALRLLAEGGVGWPAAWQVVRDICADPSLTRAGLVGAVAEAAPGNTDVWAAALQGIASPEAVTESALQLDEMFARLQALPATRRARPSGGPSVVAATPGS